MQYTLEINLLSAASPGSGEGWAGMIDSDVFFDDFGLPFIPSKRIRGILREMAYDVASAFESSLEESSYFNRDHVMSLFGKEGQQNTSPLSIQDAYFDDYQQTRKWLQWASLNLDALFTPDRVIDTFTYLRQQTAIDSSGTAQDGSLRTTRVLNRGLRFFSDITLVNDDNKHKTLLALAVRIAHSLGSKRNRGLGRIRCRLLMHDGQELTVDTRDEVQKLLGVKNS